MVSCGRELDIRTTGNIAIAQRDGVFWGGDASLKAGTLRVDDATGRRFEDFCGKVTVESNPWIHFCNTCAVKNGLIW